MDTATSPPEKISGTADGDKLLKELVVHHQVCLEVRPKYDIDQAGRREQVGYEIELSGIHYHPQRTPIPGCPECAVVQNALRRLALSALPTERRDSAYRLRVQDGSIGYSSLHRGRAEVSLIIDVVHRKDFHRPVDACEDFCLREIQDRLMKLGVQRGKWPG